MPDFDFDLFTIGAGSGGVAASRRAGAYGARVAICEESRVGGTCVIRGCVPKKLLVYASHFHDEYEDARGFGWDEAQPGFDWPKLIAAKNTEVDRLNRTYLRLLRDSGVKLFEARGRVIDAHTVEVEGKRYTARYILVATGARPTLPSIPGIEHAITSNEALDLPTLPKRVVIVGGGYIGVEFAGIFRSLGSQVTMVLRGDTVLRGFDDDVRSALGTAMRSRGIVLRTDSFIEDIARDDDGSLSAMTRVGETLEADVVMYATGRHPNTRGLGLEDAGVALDAHGAITVDPMSRTAVRSVYAVGDCTNRLNLTPVAIGEGRAVAENLFNGKNITFEHTDVPTAVFSQPPVGTVGLSEREARESNGAIDVYVTSFRPMRHSLSGRDERTMMKLVVDRATDRVIGAHMVGADAPEIMQGIGIALKCGATKAQFDATVGIHPTAAEEFVTMRDRRPEPVKEDIEAGPE